MAKFKASGELWFEIQILYVFDSLYLKGVQIELHILGKNPSIFSSALKIFDGKLLHLI